MEDELRTLRVSAEKRGMFSALTSTGDLEPRKSAAKDRRSNVYGR